jgi:hypothetical protein
MGLQMSEDMRRIIDLNVPDLTPTPEEVLANQGMAGRTLPERIKKLLDSALEIFAQLAEPKGIVQDLAISEFDALYDGNGLNSSEGPVPGIIPKADAVALFAATLGDALIAKSSDLFKQGGPALGFMLDAVNTGAAERLGRRMGLYFLNSIQQEKPASAKTKVQYYSPGHCGWHISGQEKIFQALHPEEIGITINERWVMQPIKSISGVLVVGDLEIHRFPPAFSFCKQCKEHKCVKRLLLLESEN